MEYSHHLLKQSKSPFAISDFQTNDLKLINVDFGNCPINKAQYFFFFNYADLKFKLNFVV